jgi:hypothetical protein
MSAVTAGALAFVDSSPASPHGRANHFRYTPNAMRALADEGEISCLAPIASRQQRPCHGANDSR